MVLSAKCVFVVLFINSLILIVAGANDPYKVLGVNRHAASHEIRRAYKQLAKEW